MVRVRGGREGEGRWGREGEGRWGGKVRGKGKKYGRGEVGTDKLIFTLGRCEVIVYKGAVCVNYHLLHRKPNMWCATCHLPKTFLSKVINS